jgi:hypothetical protein
VLPQKLGKAWANLGGPTSKGRLAGGHSIAHARAEQASCDIATNALWIDITGRAERNNQCFIKAVVTEFDI